MKVHDRGSQWNDYLEIGFGLTIEVESKKIKEIKFASTDKQMTEIYYDKQSFLETLSEKVDEYKLRWQSKTSKTVMVIYTDNLMKIKGFFKDNITDSFNDLYIQLFDFFEFRLISRWQDIHDVYQIADYAQYLIDTLFLPNKYFYLTPNQVPRRAIKRACDDNTASKIFPTSYKEYSIFRKALFGGICYVPFRDFVIEEPLMCLDLTSAYIYDLCIEKHCISAFEYVNAENWRYYLDSENHTSIGNYIIKYASITNKIHCFKDIDGNNFEKGEHTVTTIMTSVDLKTLLENTTVLDIKCNWLFACKTGSLPKYMIDEVVNQYIKKVELKNDKKAYNLQKPIVNGIFGDCIRDFSEKEFDKAKKAPSVAPQWGIWCCSYAKKNLLKLATKVEGWVYSDTDSIYCNDNQYNRDLVKAYNKEVQTKVKAFCTKFGYDYEKLKDLGTFKVEKKIKKFKAVTQKVYMYTTTDNQFHLTAAGLDQSTIDVDESLYNKPIPFGSRLYKYITEDGYYEERKGGLESALTTIELTKQIKKQY